jgi:hypothetical protein
MPLLFSPVCSPTCLLQVQSFSLLFRVHVGRCSPPLSGGAWYGLATFTSLPLSKHTGGGCCCFCLLAPVCLFTDRVKECLSPTLWWSILCFSWFYKPSPLQAHWGGGGAASPTFSCWLVYSQLEWELLLPLSQKSGPHHLFAKCLFFFSSCLFIIQIVFFFFYPWVGVSLSRGLCWFTVCCLAHLVVSVFPNSLGDGIWLCRSPPGFSVYHGVGMLCGLVVCRSWSFSSSCWFFLKGVSPVSLQDFTLGSMLSPSSL